MMGNSLVELVDVTVMHGQNIIFDKLSLTIKKHSITAILGPSGVGKTTLLKIITKQITPSSGRVLIDGCDLSTLNTEKLLSIRRKMGLLFQSSALFTDLNVFENVAFPLRENTNLSESLIRNLVLMKLQAVGLRGVAEFFPSQLSGGMARRIAFARAAIMDPYLMMYDEPFTGQDPISLGVLVNLIKHQNKIFGTTTILVSHDVQITCNLADDVYFLSEGKIIASGSASIMLENVDPSVKQFMHGESDGKVPFHYPAQEYIEELIND